MYLHCGHAHTYTILHYNTPVTIVICILTHTNTHYITEVTVYGRAYRRTYIGHGSPFKPGNMTTIKYHVNKNWPGKDMRKSEFNLPVRCLAYSTASLKNPPDISVNALIMGTFK